MSNTNDLLVISASNGENLKLAQRFTNVARELGATSELLDLTTSSLPLFNPRTKIKDRNSNVIGALSTQMNSIPRWVICAPEYNGSIPPVLTSTIAWLSVEEKDFRNLFNGRPIGLASFSGGGCMELLFSMRIQLTHLGAQVVGRQISSNSNAPAKDASIKDLINRLMQMKPLKL